MQLAEVIISQIISLSGGNRIFIVVINQKGMDIVVFHCYRKIV